MVLRVVFANRNQDGISTLKKLSFPEKKTWSHLTEVKIAMNTNSLEY